MLAPEAASSGPGEVEVEGAVEVKEVKVKEGLRRKTIESYSPDRQLSISSPLLPAYPRRRHGTFTISLMTSAICFYILNLTPLD